MTVGKKFAGGAPSTVLTAPMTNVAPAAGGTFSVTAGTGANYPSAANFVVKINAGQANEEKILCSSRTGDVFTVAAGGRGYDGTTAAAHTIIEPLVHELDAATMTALVAHVDNTGQDDHSQYLNTARHDVTTRHTFGAALGTPGTPQPIGAAGSAGSGSAPAREDHVHAGSSTGTVYFTNLGAALSQSFTAEVDLTGLTSITFTADGTSRYRLHLHATSVPGTGVTLFKLYEGSTLLQVLSQKSTTDVVDGFWEWVPTAGSHTLKIRGVCTSGTGRLDTFQSGGQDTTVSVEKIGSV